MATKTASHKKNKQTAIKRRRVEPEILKAAIHLFGLYGFRGVTTRDIAREAKVVEGSVYGWFKSKEYLYIQAVNEVLGNINQEFGQFVVTVFGDTGEVAQERINQAVLAWFSSLEQPGARLLMQIIMGDDKLNKTARKPLDQMINIVAKALASQKRQSKSFDPQGAALCLVRALFQTRLTESKATAQDEIRQILHFFSFAMPSS
jgi:AcrR family transcriptional regulator